MSIQFWRTDGFSDNAFLDLIDRTFGVTFTGTTEAKTWLKNNGYFTSYPDIVDDGLVLNLDAQNKSSFRGEPTTNLIDNSDRANCIVAPNHNGVYTMTTIRTPNYNFSRNRPHTMLLESTDATGYMDFAYYPSENCISGKTYTFSFDYYIEKQGHLDNPIFVTIYKNGWKIPDTSGSGTNITQNTQNLGDGWYKRIFTYTSTYTGINVIRYNLNSGGDTGDVLFYLDNIQFEEKEHVTPFVDSTRGSTVSTGGGWIDLSGNDYNGDLTNMSYDSTGMKYNGADEYVRVTGTNINAGSWAYPEASFSIWIKPLSSSSTGDNNFITIETSFEIRYNNLNNGYSSVYYASNPWAWTGPSTINLTNDKWNNVVYVHSTSFRKIYINAIEGYNSNSTGELAVGSGTYPYLTLGARYSGTSANMTGYIDSFVIHEKVLTSSEILQNFNSQKIRFGL